MSILDLNYNNSSIVGNIVNRPDWARGIAGGQTWLDNASPRYEWTQIPDPTSEYENGAVGISGTAVLPGISAGDVPFVHPFGFDYEFYIAPDAQYNALLAPSNVAPAPGSDYDTAKNQANGRLGLSVPGVLGVETDQYLVPGDYRAQDGDRVAVLGRWIVDCGHSDFHSEIHPPLVHVWARPSPLHPTLRTESRIIGRPFLVSQEFGDGALREHLFNEVEKALTFQSLRVEAHPQIKPKPFEGVYLLSYTLRPPTPRQSPSDTLFVSYHFTIRGVPGQGGVAVQVVDGGSDSVNVIIVLNDVSYTPPSLPHKNDWSLSLDDLDRLNPDAASIYRDVIFGSLLLNPIGAGVLAQGILTDRFDAPLASSPHDNENVVSLVPVASLPNPTPVSTDNNQPFPIYGWVSVQWNILKDKEKEKEKEASKDRKDSKETAKEKENPKETAK